MSTRAGLLIVAILIAAILALAGCATKAPTGEMTASVCYLRFMGKSEEGYTVVMQVCQSPEAFAASQQ